MRFNEIRLVSTPNSWTAGAGSRARPAVRDLLEKSSLPIDFWPSQRNAQWSVEIADRMSIAPRAREPPGSPRRAAAACTGHFAPLEVRRSRYVWSTKKYSRARLPTRPSPASTRDRLHRLRQETTLQSGAPAMGELDRPVRRLPLELRGPRERVEVRRGVPAASACFTSTSIASPFSAWTITSAPVSAATHRPEERLVVDHERALVRHEELVRGHALLGQTREPRASPSRRSVTAMWNPQSMTCFPFRFACYLERVAERLPRGLDAEVDARQAAERVGLARGEVVDRDRAAEGHVEVVRGSTQPGSTYFPPASTTASASMPSDSPTRPIRSPSTYTSPT